MGFRKFPKAKFTDKDIKDEVQFQRITTRLMELGIVTPEQGVEAMETGLLPRANTLDKAQERFAADREKGYYNPLVGGVPQVEAPGAPLERDMKEKISEEQVLDRREGPIPEGTPPDIATSPPRGGGESAGRPNDSTASELYSKKGIQEVVYASEALYKFVEAKVKNQHKIKRMSKQKKELVNQLCENIITSRERAHWEPCAMECVEDMKKIVSLTAMPGVVELAAEHNLGFYPASLLYHSKNIPEESE